MDNSEYLKAKEELLTASSDDCQQFFISEGCILESAYWELFHQNPNKAREKFSKIIDADIRAKWGIFLSYICEDRIEGLPSYFELRNFFEPDFQILFNYYLGDYIENICKYSEWLFSINPEIYKYIGRVFMNNDYVNLGLHFLNKGKNNFYNDPELHYMLAQYYLKTEDIAAAKNATITCLNILPEYYPAKRLLNMLKSNTEL